MNLDLKDAEYFTKLYSKFLIFANKRLKVIDYIEKPEDFIEIDPFKQLELRKSIYKNMHHHINSFFDFGNLNDQEKIDVKSWKNFIHTEFIVCGHIKNHSLFIDVKNKGKIYGVLGLIDDMEIVMPSYNLPIMVEGTLLPFRDKIVYDGLFGAMDINDSNILKATKEYIEEASKIKNIITSLPEEISLSKDSDWDGYDKVYFYNTEKTFIRDHKKIGRNELCYCGSGKKYKKCCENKNI
ncbi:MAG: SEC-C domain-containing protein [Cyanobacteriota bacterium]